MKVSIVTISFNQARFLARTIESVISQTGVSVEYIMVDPGSTDGSREIIQRYRKYFDHLILEPDEGPADGLNRGLAVATGEYFGYINSDDELVPGALVKACAELERDTSLDVVYANGIAIDAQGKVLRQLTSARIFSPTLHAYGQAVIIQQAAFMRTSSLRRAGGFNARNRTCWDGEAFLDIALSGGRFRRVWDIWGLFRFHDDSISGSGRTYDQFLLDNGRLFRKVMARERRSLDSAVGICFKIVTRLIDIPRILVDLGGVLGIKTKRIDILNR